MATVLQEHTTFNICLRRQIPSWNCSTTNVDLNLINSQTIDELWRQ